MDDESSFLKTLIAFSVFKIIKKIIIKGKK